VNEQEWAVCDNPDEMLNFLQGTGCASERKLRLFAVACCRRIWHLMTDDRSRRIVVVSELDADGKATEQECIHAFGGALEAWGESGLNITDERWFLEPGPPMTPEEITALAMHAANIAALRLDQHSSSFNPEHVAAKAARAIHFIDYRNSPERPLQCALLRDIFGPLPFRPIPPLLPSVKTWDDGIIVKLATAIYEERTLPEGTLDSLRLGVLADALEEAGVSDPDIIGHLRHQGAVHTRGCYVIDWLLGKQ
jgi:hypothetical protein